MKVNMISDKILKIDISKVANIDPAINVWTRKPPAAAYFEGGNLLGCGEPVDCSFSHLQVVCDFPDRENYGFGWSSRHGLCQLLENMIIIVQNFQLNNNVS